MPGITYWDGSASTDCTAAANWTIGAGPGSAPPVAGDEVIFDGVHDAGGNDPTTVCAVGNTGGIDYDLFHVKKGYTGTIGAAGSPFHTSAKKIIIEGSGTYFIEVSENAVSADQIIPLVIINNKDATVYLTSNENTGSWVCEFTRVVCIAGTVIIGNDGSSDVATTVQYLDLMPLNGQSSNVTVTMHEDCIRSKATAFDVTVSMDGGTFELDSAALLIEQFGGTLTYGADGSAETGLDIDKLVMHGGNFKWQPDDTGDDAYIELAYIYGGVFDASGTTNNDRAKVLGNGAGNDIFLYEGATMKLNNNVGNITMAAGSQFWNFGGVLDLDNGVEIAWTHDSP